MRKKLTALLVLVSLVISIIAPSVMAEENYIVISTADELIELAYSKDESDLKKDYCLNCDIDMNLASDTRPMKAIGSYGEGDKNVAFEGVFDGKGHKIINLKTDSEALFGYVGEKGTLRNLILEKASVHFQKNDSSKYPAALVSLNKGDIENCYSVKSAVVSEYCSPAGGLIGTNFGTVKKCGVSGGYVKFVGNIGTSHGGFVGNMRGGNIEECYATAMVEAKKWVGGFVGKIEDGTISDCFATGTVNGTDENGGFAGALAYPGVIRNVYASNNINSKSGGGLVGGIGFSFAEPGTIENSYYNRDSKKAEDDGNFENIGDIAEKEMKTVNFASMLSDKWSQDNDKYDGFPYLINAEYYQDTADEITVKLMIANYNHDVYEFEKISENEITLKKNTVTVSDIMESAADNGLLTYAWGENESSTQIITIDGITPKAPDGWMFAINDELSYVGASAATVSDGDEILWFVGTPENSYNPPKWENIDNNEYILISSAEELINLSHNSDGWDKNYKLDSNIDLTEKEFLPIGNEEKPFVGIFDGCGYEIQNLTINKDENSKNIGLFGVICGAELRNIKIVNADITGGSVIGVLAGKAEADKDGATVIASCSVEGKIKANGNSYIKQTDVGGLVGVNDVFSENKINNMSAIDKCMAYVSVIAGEEGETEAGHAGGLVGLNKGIISDSSAYGDVSGGNTTGGFVGVNYGGKIYNSEAEGNVSGAYSCGGFAGSCGLFSLTENCNSRGDVVASDKKGSYFGGFAGTVSGTVKNCVSTGTVFCGESFNGGFAGKFSGNIWSYNDDLRNIKNCFGNVYTNDGKKIKALGDYIGGVHVPTDKAAEEIGVDKETAQRKIKEISAKSILEEEAAKYKSSSAIPSTVAEGADITSLVAKLNINTSASEKIAVSYKSDNDIIKADESGFMLNRKCGGSENVTLTFLSGDAEYNKDINVILLAENNDIDSDELLENTSEKFLENCDNYWKSIFLSVYDKINGTDYSDKNYAKKALDTIRKSDADTSVAMSIIALCALGYDPTDIVMTDGEKFNAYDALNKTQSSGNNGDAYKLLAYLQCGYDNEKEIENVKTRLVDSMIDGKGWSNNADNGIDPDTTGAVILGLAGYCSDERVKEAINGAVEYLSGLVQADGNIKSSYKESNYGTNANTTAICVMGLEAAGIKIIEDSRFANNSVSLFDGLMSFAEKDGFVYDYSEKKINTLATEQGVLALLAAKKNINVFDFSENKKIKLNLQENTETKHNTGSGTLNGGNIISAEKQENKIQFTLIGDAVHAEGKHENYQIWIDEETVELSENMTAAEAVKKILEEKKYQVKGLENGYVSEITTMDGIILGEYTNGQNSGWLYSVNNKMPEVGICDYILKNGDILKLYYIDDWSKVRFKDVKTDDWFAKAVDFTAENGYIAGNENGEFMPDAALTRAMAVTILGRYDGVVVSEYKDSRFEDVESGSWYAEYVSWAADKKIVSGIDENNFAPSENITREQMAAILFRYVQSKKTENVVGDLKEFSDCDDISEWAKEAVIWAKSIGLIAGMGDGKFAPKECATRAQFAVIIMNLNNFMAERDNK